MQTITEQQLIPVGHPDQLTSRGVAKQHILVALSGGADSTALLVALWRLRNRLKLRLFALYVNHGLRPAAVLRREELHCQRLCENLGVPLQIERVDIPKLARQHKISLETAGRQVRYQLLQDHALHIKANLIATGHHQDDQIETVLFRLLRGGWLDSLAGIPYRRGVIIRPLLDCKKSEILFFLRREKRGFLKDSSNKDMSFSRNKIRGEILPLLRKLLPTIETALLGYSLHARRFSQQTGGLVEKFLNQHSFLTPCGKLLVDRQQFTRLSPDMSCHVIREGVQRVTSHFSTISPDQAGEAIEVAQNRMESVNLSDGMTLRQGSWPGFKVEDLLVLSPKSVRMDEVVIELPPKGKQSVSLFSGRARMSISHTRILRIPGDPYSVKLDASKVISPLVVRPWKSGDRIVMLGMKGSKKVGDILTDRKFPAFMRDEQLVVADQTGIIWLVGHVIADRVKLTPATKTAIQLKFEIREDCL